MLFGNGMEWYEMAVSAGIVDGFKRFGDLRGLPLSLRIGGGAGDDCGVTADQLLVYVTARKGRGGSE